MPTNKDTKINFEFMEYNLMRSPEMETPQMQAQSSIFEGTDFSRINSMFTPKQNFDLNA